MCLTCWLVPECKFCGKNCQGQCSDPDSCPSCWAPVREICRHPYAGGIAEWESCFDTECVCSCHSVADTPEYDSFNNPGYASLAAGQPASQNPFRFMDLPFDVRSKVYKLAMRQEGRKRMSPYFKGRVDLSILLTCRKIYNEAWCIPLAVNQIWFASPFHGLEFFASLTARQRKLIKDCSLDVHIWELLGSGSVTQMFHQPLDSLAAKLTKLKLNGFGLTLMGPMSTEMYNYVASKLDFVFGFKEVRDLRVVIASEVLSDDAKHTIGQNIKAAETRAPKRKFFDTHSEQNPHPSFKRIRTISSSAVIKMAHNTAAQPARSSAQIAFTRAQLLYDWQRLDTYARASPEAYQLVHIRMPRARQLAEQANITEYDAVTNSIKRTLNDHYGQIKQQIQRMMELWTELERLREIRVGTYQGV